MEQEHQGRAGEMIRTFDLERHPRLITALELAWILGWTLWLGRAYLDMDPGQWPVGQEFGMAIHPHVIWTRLSDCGACVLWNGYINGGQPTFGELHAAVAHPLVIAGTVLFGVVNGAKVALLGSLFTAGLAQWWLARVMGLGRLARLWVAGMAVAGGHLAGRMEHGVVGVVISTAACSLVLAPALQVALHGRRRDAVLLGVTLALAIVAGQGYLQIALFVGILPLFLLLLFEQGRLRAPWKAFALSILLALLLAGVYLVPLAHFLPQIVKDVDPAFVAAQPLSYMPLNLVIGEVDFFQNRLLGREPWPYLYLNYIGWIPVVLAIAAVRLVPRRQLKLFLFLWLGVGTVLLLASALPFQWLARILPETQGSLVGIRSAPLMVGLAVPFVLGLAGWGLDLLARQSWPSLSLGTAGDVPRLSVNTKVLVLPLLLFWSLRSVYQFSHPWWETQAPPPETDLVAELQVQSAQWVAMPFGDHYWVPAAAEQGLKLTNQARPAYWRDRAPPPPFLSLVRGEDASVTPWRTLDGFALVRDAESQYASVRSGQERLPCTAEASGGHIDVVCDADVPGRLVVRENGWSGWRVWRDGERVWLGQEGGWLAVTAPAGRHTYAFRYAPWDAQVGVGLTMLGLVSAAFAWWPGLLAAFRSWLGLARVALRRWAWRRAR